MKMNKADFEKKVREMRKTLPTWNGDRKVVLLSEYSKKGQYILSSASRWDGYDLRQVYDKYSDAKKQAYDSVFQMYADDEDSDHGSFGICSHNSFAFTVSWTNKKGLVFFITSTTEYIVVCNE